MHSFSILSIIATLAAVNAENYGSSGYNTCAYGVLQDNKGHCCASGQVLNYGFCCDPPIKATTTPPAPYTQTTSSIVPTTTATCQVMTSIIVTTTLPATNNYYVQTKTIKSAYYAPTGYSSQQMSNAIVLNQLKASIFVGILFALVC